MAVKELREIKKALKEDRQAREKAEKLAEESVNNENLKHFSIFTYILPLQLGYSYEKVFK